VPAVSAPALPAAPVPAVPAAVLSPAMISTVACSGSSTLTSLSGSISDGPSNYLPNQNCQFTISTGSAITLTFTRLDTEAGYDVLTVYEGTGSIGTQLGSFSGSSVPDSITATSGSMHVVFSADDSVEAGGFDASYYSGSAAVPSVQVPAVPAAPVPAGPVAVPAPATSSTVACSGSSTLTSPSGSISDGPASYSSNQNCQFTISTGSAITLSFSSFSTEAQYDYLKIYDGSSSSGTQLGSFSGASMPGPVTATSGSMFVVFTADDSVEASGFDASYMSGSAAVPSVPSILPAASQATAPSPATNLVCPGSSTLSVSSTGTTISDGPGNYLSNANCRWTFIATSPITVMFNDMQTEANYDFVKVYDGQDVTSSRQLGQFSGSQGRGVTITSSSTGLTITFVSDESQEAPGFEAFVTTK